MNKHTLKPHPDICHMDDSTIHFSYFVINFARYCIIGKHAFYLTHTLIFNFFFFFFKCKYRQSQHYESKQNIYKEEMWFSFFRDLQEIWIMFPPKQVESVNVFK